MSDVRILRIAAGGDGVGKLEDGRAVFIPRSAPGDLVEPVQLRLHRRFARARVGRLVEAAPARVVPRCPHYVENDCGGCQLQHLDDEAQRAARRGFVGDALRRLGGVDVPDPAIVPALSNWEYRTRLTLHLSKDGRRIGLHPLERPTEVFDLVRCHITDARLMELWTVLSRFRQMLPQGLEHLVLRLDRDGGCHVIARVRGTPQWTRARELAPVLAAAGVGATLWWQPEDGAARVVSGGEEAFPATVFEQVHPDMGRRARDAALDALGEVRGAHVWDLYAGIGETTAHLLDRGATVESVESDPRAVDYAERHGSADRARVIRHAGRAEALMRELRPPARVITNPPRTGMDERVTAALSASGAERLVYISCDPATLARDVSRLGAAYRVASVQAFDLFPQTAHVESVVALERV